MATPEELRRKAFFNCWTRKEAFIKADGRGLSLGLEKFAVSLADDSPALLNLEGDPQAPARWNLRAFKTREDYAAALAVEGPIRQLHCWEFTSNADEKANIPAGPR
jgi:4'-phosphopantetheinyl transferase